MTKLKASLIASVLILISSIYLYYQGFKDDFWLHILSYLLLLISWMIIYFNYLGKYALSNLPKKDKWDKRKVRTKKVISTLFYITLGVTVVTNIFLMNELGYYRVNQILRYKPTQIATAQVRQFEERYSKGGSKHYVTITYQISDRVITRSVYDYKREYSIGQKLRISYSVEYPEMFRVIRALN